MAFHVGQEVVCIYDGWRCRETGMSVTGRFPVKGSVYIVSSIQFYDNNLYLEFVGLENVAWCNSECFRPVQKRKTDISALKALLNTTPAELMD